MLRRAGLYIGTDLNESEDALRFGAYSDRWIDAYLPHRGRTVPRDVEQAMLGDLAGVVGEHCAAIAEQPRRWGWKEPRSIYLVPFFADHLPALRFVHVVRDGRDMALSSNQNQLLKHGDAAPIPAHLPPPIRSAALWGWINLEAARHGDSALGGRYLRMRYEDLCARPIETVRALLDFLELDADPKLALDVVASPASLGRWRDESPELVSALEREAGPALEAFGYQTSASGRPPRPAR